MKPTTKSTTMNRNDIDTLFTAKVTGLLAQGYIIHPSTMSSNEGEIAKVDMRRGDELLRVWMENDQEWHSDIEVLHISIGRCNEKACLQHGYGTIGCKTVWNDHLEVLEDTELAVIDAYKGIFASVEDGKAIGRLRMERMAAHKNWGDSSKELTSDKAKAIALKYIQRQTRMTNCKLADITKVERIVYHDWRTAQPIFEGYRITARGKSYTLKPAKS